jgi:hypothetical protein
MKLVSTPAGLRASIPFVQTPNGLRPVIGSARNVAVGTPPPGGGGGGGTPPPGADYSVATLSALRALTPTVGETAYVTSLGKTFDCVDKSAVTFPVPDDGTYVLAPNSEVSVVSAPSGLSASQVLSYNLGPTKFGSLVIQGNVTPPKGADRVRDLDLHGAMWYNDSRTGPIFDHATGTFNDQYLRLKAALDFLGTSFTMSWMRVSGDKRWVCRDFKGYAPEDLGALPGDLVSLLGNSAAQLQAGLNRGAINWAYRLAALHTGTVGDRNGPRTLRGKDTIEYAGVLQYQHNTSTVGLGDLKPLFRCIGNNLLFEYERKINGTKPYTVARYLLADVVSFMRPYGDCSHDFFDFYHDGNARGNELVYTDPDYTFSSDVIVYFQNAPVHVGLSTGVHNNWTRPVAPTPVRWHGRCRLSDYFSHCYDIAYESFARPQLIDDGLTPTALIFGDAGHDDNHHATYGFSNDVTVKRIEMFGRSCDFMCINGRSDVDAIVYRDPRESSLQPTRTFAMMGVRPNSGSSAGVNRYGRIEADLPERCDFLFGNGSGTPARLNAAENGGVITARFRVFTLVLDGFRLGDFGPNSTSLSENGRMIIRHASGVTNSSFRLFGGQTTDQTLEDVRWRNLDVLSAGANDSHYVAYRLIRNKASRVRLENILAQGSGVPGTIAMLKPRTDGAAGDIYITLGDIDAATLIKRSYYLQATTESDKEQLRHRVICDGAVIPSASGTHINRALRARNTTDRAGRVSEQTGVYTATGSEGATFYIPTNLLSGAAQHSVSPTNGGPAVVSVESVTATTDTVFDRNGGGDYRSGRLKVTLASAPTAGQTYSWDAKVTSDVEWDNRDIRPHVLSAPSQTVTVGGTKTLDLTTVFQRKDWDENVVAGTLTYVVSSSDGAKVTGSVSGNTLTINGVAAGNADLYIDATDVGNATTRASISVTAS